MRYLERDPFGRTTKVRKVYDGGAKECGWCGSTRKLFIYGVKSDAQSEGSVNFSRKGFCQKSCWEAYG